MGKYKNVNVRGNWKFIHSFLIISSYFGHFVWDYPNAQRCIWYCSQRELYLLLFGFLSEENFNFGIDFGLRVFALLMSMAFDV